MTPEQRAEAIRILRQEVRAKVAHYDSLPRYDSELRRAYLTDLAETVAVLSKLERHDAEVEQ